MMLNVLFYYFYFFKVTPRQLFSQTSNIATLVPLNSTKLNEMTKTTSKQYSTFRGSNDENGSVESYATFQV